MKTRQEGRHSSKFSISCSIPAFCKRQYLAPGSTMSLPGRRHRGPFQYNTIKVSGTISRNGVPSKDALAMAWIQVGAIALLQRLVFSMPLYDVVVWLSGPVPQAPGNRRHELLDAGGRRYFTRVSVATQLSSQVLPPSSEKACSKRTVSASIGMIRKRTKTARPSKFSWS